MAESINLVFAAPRQQISLGTLIVRHVPGRGICSVAPYQPHREFAKNYLTEQVVLRTTYGLFPPTHKYNALRVPSLPTPKKTRIE
jgi:hypothetical protein